MYLDASGQPTRDSLVGWRAAGVPGTVRGLELAHKKYGRKPWVELLQPAIEFAAQGFELSYATAKSICGSSGLLERFPDSKRIFLRLNGLKASGCPEPGEKLVQPELARTLERIAHNGRAGVLRRRDGRATGRADAGQRRADHTLGPEELPAVERRPLAGVYKGYGILTAPPPSSGGVALLEMLGLLEGTGYEKPGAGSAASTHYLAEVMRRTYADRAEYLGDSDFVHVRCRVCSIRATSPVCARPSIPLARPPAR